MAEILSRKTQLQVNQARTDDQLCPGQIYIAPPNKHLVVNAKGRLCLLVSPRIHFVRPAADYLFESVAASFGPRAIAVVLTGRGTDGAAGVKAIKRRGGRVIVQAPETALYASMPQKAIATGAVDWILPLADIALKLIELAQPQGAG